MRRMSSALLAAAFLAGSSTLVLAQSASAGPQNGSGNQAADQGQTPDRNATGSGYADGPWNGPANWRQSQINRDWVPGPLSTAAENNGDESQYSRTWPPGALSSEAESSNGQNARQGQSRSNQRVLLRQELRQAGFQNIRILDAMFLVQARTQSGQSVLMVVNPPELNNLTTSSSSGSSQRSNDQGPSNQRQQFGSSQNFGTGQNPNRFSSAITRPGLLNEDQIRSDLQSRGFSNISGLNKDGNTYTGMADWYGEQVDFRVDGRNGYVIDPNHMTPNQVRTMLDGQGWNSISSIQPQGSSYRVQASRNGTSYNLWVDARTGEIDRGAAAND